MYIVREKYALSSTNLYPFFFLFLFRDASTATMLRLFFARLNAVYHFVYYFSVFSPTISNISFFACFLFVRWKYFLAWLSAVSRQHQSAGKKKTKRVLCKRKEKHTNHNRHPHRWHTLVLVAFFFARLLLNIVSFMYSYFVSSVLLLFVLRFLLGGCGSPNFKCYTKKTRIVDVGTDGRI